jgi:Rps23 Pro-64 3,4-dihydroxylase Tpa1-like proline 4-hydroxylase
VLIKPNLFSNELLAKLNVFSRDENRPMPRVNFFSYPQDVVGFSNAVFCFDLNEELKNEVAKELIAQEIIVKNPTKWDAHIQLYSRASGIPWHDDRNHIYSGAVYLNQQWDHNWGGYFAYEEDNEIKCIKPTFNTGAFFKPPMLHTVMVTAGNAPFRESLQIFVDEF